MNRISAFMNTQGLTPTTLAKRAGLSRQALYRMLDPGYDPFPAGFRAVAVALGVFPEQLIESPKTRRVEETLALARDAAGGDARAFEVLPAALHALCPRERSALDEVPDPERRLLAAAADVLLGMKEDDGLRAWTSAQAEGLSENRAFFFGGEWMDPERLIATTPSVLAKRRVYGAFDLASFARHVMPEVADASS